MRTFERLTEPAQRVMLGAEEEARQLWYTRIGTEHLLLSLRKHDEGVVGRVFEALNISENDIRRTVLELSDDEVRGSTPDPLPCTPELLRVVEDRSRKEATRITHGRLVAPEHLLLGILREVDPKKE